MSDSGYTAAQMLKGKLRDDNGRCCILGHLQDKYGRGNCKDALAVAVEVIEELHPIPRRTNALYLGDWSNSVTEQDMADVLNETIRRIEAQ